MTNAVFRHEPVEMFSSNITKNVQNEILAQGIPALSYATGRNHINPLGSAGNLDIATLKDNGWPGRGGDLDGFWLHNDIRKMAYLYTFRAFDEMVNQGELK